MLAPAAPESGLLYNYPSVPVSVYMSMGVIFPLFDKYADFGIFAQ